MQTSIHPYEKLTVLDNFGHSLRAQSYVYKPTSVGEIAGVFEFAKHHGLKVTARGAGRSYNDASLNGGGIVMDLSRMNKVQAWNPQTGIITAEPGLTLEGLWHVVLPDSWWPPVVSGTMTTTLGGCLGTNIHGKNNFRMGPIGEHVLEFNAILPTGAQITCSPHKNGDLFYSMISGLGMLGVFTSITLQMKKVHSGLLEVRGWSVPNLETHLHDLAENAPQADYTVGWLDALAGGNSLGRGQVHIARYLQEGEDPHPRTTALIKNQMLPSNIFGVPKGILHYFIRPFSITPFWTVVNTAKYILGMRREHFRQSHAAFHFLLDYIPNWERAAGRGGLIQYQSFLPKETAHEAWTELLSLSHKRGLHSYVAVTKRHRPDKFLLSHAVDGFSLALDFKVTDGRRARLSEMLQDFDKIVVQAGGRFYFAKNSETTAETARRFLGNDTLEHFKALKRRTDPHGLLESDLYRRIFGSS
jgi:FAD/FMN-containing dehydrogenase